jgi:hypothetical protein
MIGKIVTGKSFYHCIGYCLEDKKGLSTGEKIVLSAQQHLQHLNRAEILEYNLCFGDKRELAEQFRDVQRLSHRVEKPVLHMTLRLAPGDQLSKQQLIEIGKECVSEFGVADHQYLTVLHKDTREQHIHIVANRVGFDGKAAKDSNNYKRMANLCRRLEKKYHLQEVLNPRPFLSSDQQRLPRHDRRRQQLKENIAKALEQADTFADFKKAMQDMGYQVLKGRGISFIDRKKVKTKGSEVGFSLKTLEKIFRLKMEISTREKTFKSIQDSNRRALDKAGMNEQGMLKRLPPISFITSLKNELADMIADIMKSEGVLYGGGISFSREEKRRKRRRKPNF